ncbi:MAG TPA: hypothetical protein PL009_13065 [Flavipsychrobacter sp.]|nr:hypothetical protein [Flavipsychrobacter sp.]
MKEIFLIAAFLGITLTTQAQVSNADVSATAQQAVQLGLTNALEISYTSNESTTGGTITFPFTSANDYANGVTSGDQEMKIKSNRTFNVSVKAAANTFTYSGTTSPAPVMYVYSTLSCMITANTTGGNIPAPFSANSYYGIGATAQNIIANATAGGDKRFSCKFRANPGFAFPAGTYTVDVIFTATQQ